MCNFGRKKQRLERKRDRELDIKWLDAFIIESRAGLLKAQNTSIQLEIRNKNTKI